jgi:hypothetical protein
MCILHSASKYLNIFSYSEWAYGIEEQILDSNLLAGGLVIISSFLSNSNNVYDYEVARRGSLPILSFYEVSLSFWNSSFFFSPSLL